MPPAPLLISSALFSNLGGAMTMIGDPPNIIIGNLLGEYVDFVDFIVHMVPPVMLAVVPSFLFLRWYYAAEYTQQQKKMIVDEAKVQHLMRTTSIRDEPMLLQAGLVLTTVIVLFFLEPLTHVNPAWIAIAGAGAVLLLQPANHLAHVVKKIEWDTLVFFAALFVMVEAMQELGLIDFVGEKVVDFVSGVQASKRLVVAVALLIWVSAVCSAFVDNIPFTLTLIPIILHLHQHPSTALAVKPLAFALAYGACIGGNGTLAGASANVVAISICENAGVHVSFKDWFKVGFPLMLIQTAVGSAWLCFAFSYIHTEQ
jgi:Na+/H+ antiporter NhaD/arsenite permease-like protein